MPWWCTCLQRVTHPSSIHLTVTRPGVKPKSNALLLCYQPIQVIMKSPTSPQMHYYATSANDSRCSGEIEYSRQFELVHCSPVDGSVKLWLESLFDLPTTSCPEYNTSSSDVTGQIPMFIAVSCAAKELFFSVADDSIVDSLSSLSVFHTSTPVTTSTHAEVSWQ